MKRGNRGAEVPRGVVYQPLVIVLAAAIAGILLDRWADVPLLVWFSLLACCWASWFSCWRLRRSQAAAWGLLLSVVCLSAAWHHCWWQHFSRHDVAVCTASTAGPICCEGRIVSAPQQRLADSGRGHPEPTRITRCELRVSRIRDGSTWRRAVGTCYLSVVGERCELQPGDRVQVLGRISGIRPPDNPGEFDFASLQRSKHRLRRIVVRFPQAIRVMQRCSVWHPVWILPRLRAKGCELLKRYISEARSDLATAMLLGVRHGIDARRSNQFLVSGTVHLLAISGLHVGILTWGIWLLGRCGLVSRKWTLRCMILFVAFYAAITSAQPPIVRAGTLIGLMCVARHSGRQSSALNSLAAAGLLVLLLNPTSLFRIGTQLSFLAVAALTSFDPLRRLGHTPVDALDRLIHRSRPWWRRASRRLVIVIIQVFATTSVIWLATTPLVVTHFHVISFVALFVNPLVSMPISVVLFSGFGVLLFGSFCPPLAQIFGACCDTALAWVERAIQLSGSMPGGHLWTPAPPVWWTCLFYGIVLTWILLPSVRQRRSWMAVTLSGWILAGVLYMVAASHHSAPPGELRCTFIAVGHGTSVLLELPEGQTWLYDAGCLGNARSAATKISGVLWHRGIGHLNGVILSHADADHYNALPGLLERFSVDAVFVSPFMFRNESTALHELRNSIRAHGVPLHTLTSGMQLSTTTAATLDVLHPPPHGLLGSDNAHSIVLRVRCANRCLLLPGDLETPGTQHLLRMPGIDCDVLMAPHHGSLTCHPSDVAAWATPDWVVISGGVTSSLSAGKQAYSSRGALVLHTAEVGAIRVHMSMDAVTVHPWRPQRRSL